MSSNKRAEIERLLDESYEIESILSTWQINGFVTPQELREGQERYQSWYARATPLVSEVTRDQFKNMYEGGVFIQRIKSFLGNPIEINQFYDSTQADSPIPKWTYPFSTTFLNSFHEQRCILQAEIYSVAEAAPILSELAEAFARFPSFLQVLQSSGRSNIPAPRIEREEDLQVLVGACLRLLYDDVRPEDYVPDYGGGRSRVDFLLPAVGIVVETKMTRKTLTDKKVGEELLIDWGRYTRHPDCRGIFALVYDPDRRLVNPAGLQSDLSQDQSNPATRVIVVR
ncbi:hypothetical protein [Streptomyces sp. NPDC006668]|uniref:PD-(D/E)XK nuclease domain-containing protein n=1 Tax=Streptomyces sp. NPDC006668 TaxID=3156903 RepID=UPI0034060963